MAGSVGRVTLCVLAGLPPSSLATPRRAGLPGAVSDCKAPVKRGFRALTQGGVASFCCCPAAALLPACCQDCG